MTNTPLPLSQKRNAFTLMEMMIVLGIIALLVGIGATVLPGVGDTADEQAARAQINTIQTGLMAYKVNTLTLPSEAQGLQALVEKPTGSQVPNGWKQVMEPSGILDPWGNVFRYKNPGKRKPTSYDIYSLGKDGKDGTEDDVYKQ